MTTSGGIVSSTKHNTIPLKAAPSQITNCLDWPTGISPQYSKQAPESNIIPVGHGSSTNKIIAQNYAM